MQTYRCLLFCCSGSHLSRPFFSKMIIKPIRIEGEDTSKSFPSRKERNCLPSPLPTHLPPPLIPTSSQTRRPHHPRRRRTNPRGLPHIPRGHHPTSTPPHALTIHPYKRNPLPHLPPHPRHRTPIPLRARHIHPVPMEIPIQPPPQRTAPIRQPILLLGRDLMFEVREPEFRRREATKVRKADIPRDEPRGEADELDADRGGIAEAAAGGGGCRVRRPALEVGFASPCGGGETGPDRGDHGSAGDGGEEGDGRA